MSAGPRFLTVGVDYHSAPASIRELLAFDGPKLGDGLAGLARSFPGCEAVVLSTCNRVEVYLASEEEVPEAEEIVEFLGQFHRTPPDRFATHLVSHHNEGAVGHLFRVASSLESLVIGEGQILGQVRDAYQSAVSAGTVRSLFHGLFQHALRVGKKVRESTGLDQGRVSVASVAVEVARDVFDTFADKTVLVIGAGKMAELTLQHLAALKPGRILITNRNPERAEAAARRWQAETTPFERLGQALVDADLIISTTAADQPIVTREQFARVQRARRNRLCLILDIAVPRDFEEKVGDLEQVLLYNVDDLMGQAEQNKQVRRQKVDSAQVIIDDEIATCLGTLRHQRQAGTILRKLGDRGEEIRLRELERLFASRPTLTPEDREAIVHMTHRLVNQFLHQPRAALREMGAQPAAEHPHSLISAARRLFGLSD